MKILSYLLLLVFGFTPAVTNAASADDAAIDQVMDRIASGFKAGDDSYSVEVMYRPLLEMLGGKEILLEAGKKIANK